MKLEDLPAIIGRVEVSGDYVASLPGRYITEDQAKFLFQIIEALREAREIIRYADLYTSPKDPIYDAAVLRIDKILDCL